MEKSYKRQPQIENHVRYPAWMPFIVLGLTLSASVAAMFLHIEIAPQYGTVTARSMVKIDG